MAYQPPEAVRNAPLKATGGYDRQIAFELARRGRADIHPALIEGWMRLEHGCMDGLDARTFSREVRIAIDCFDEDPEASDRLARSYGLVG